VGLLTEQGEKVSEPIRINILADKITFEMWCKANGLDPNDDENYNSYCEWKANS